MVYSLISVLHLLMLLTVIKFLMEENILILLMVMELAVLLSSFLIFIINGMNLTLTNMVVTFLSMLILESVLCLSMFVNLMRLSSADSVKSMKISSL